MTSCSSTSVAYTGTSDTHQRTIKCAFFLMTTSSSMWDLLPQMEMASQSLTTILFKIQIIRSRVSTLARSSAIVKAVRTCKLIRIRKLRVCSLRNSNSSANIHRPVKNGHDILTIRFWTGPLRACINTMLAKKTKHSKSKLRQTRKIYTNRRMAQGRRVRRTLSKYLPFH